MSEIKTGTPSQERENNKSPIKLYEYYEQDGKEWGGRTHIVKPGDWEPDYLEEVMEQIRKYGEYEERVPYGEGWCYHRIGRK